MSTETRNPLKDSAIQHTLRGLSDLNRIHTPKGGPETKAKELFLEALHKELGEIRTEVGQKAKPH